MGSIKNLAVLISGTGTVCHAIHTSCQKGVLQDTAKVALVISTNRYTDALHNLVMLAKYDEAYFYMPWKDPGQWHFQMYEMMEWYNVDLICMAGFIKKIQVWPEWEGRILNTHPSLLPKFGGKGMYGLAVHEAVIDSGETETGCTVHVVNNEYDSGRILGQSKFELCEMEPNYRKVPTFVSNWVKAKEYELYPQVIFNYFKEQYPKS